jgi:hypothetical protein
MRLSCDPLLLLPLGKLGSNGSLAGGVGAGLGSRGDAVQAEGELSSSPSGGFGVEGEGTPVDVLDGVAREVVAGVGLCVGAGEKAGGWDAEFDEGDVVGRGVKLPILGQPCSIIKVRRYSLPLWLLALLAQPVGQDISTNPVGIGGGLNPVLGLGRTNHVVVEVESDLVGIGLRELLSIVERSDETAPVTVLALSQGIRKIKLTLRHPTKQIGPCSCSPCTW